MSAPRLRKRQSSLAVLVEQERAKAVPDRDEEDSISEADEVSHREERSVVAEQPEVTSEGGDTDVAESSEDESDLPSVAAKVKSVQAKGKLNKKGRDKTQVDEVEIPSPLRASSRLKSMIRRGKYQPELLRDVTVEFEFYAGDFLTVRGEGEDFYLCRVLEDVMASNDLGWFKVAWYNRVNDNSYEASYDDECHIDAVITRVMIEEKEPGKFSLPKHHIKQTKKLLREALAQERGEEPLEEENEEDVEEVEEEDEEEEEEEEEPPAKRTRSSRGQSTPRKTSPRKGRKKKSPSPRKRKSTAKPREKKKKEKKEKPEKPRRPGVLIPNDAIELFDKDPTFETREGISLMPCKWSIRAVLLNDMKMLKEAIENVKEVHSVHWPRSPDIDWPASAYALLNSNKEAIKLLLEDSRKPKTDRCSAPETSLDRMDTGTYNFHTFGHAVRDLTASRGSKEGNNAFLGDIDNTIDPLKDELWKFCFQNDISLGTINFLLKEFKPGSDDDEQYINEEEAIQHIYLAVRAGNKKVAGHFVSKAIERDGFGFNFLHKEVLVNNAEPLSKFRAASVTKKLYGNKNVSPLHCACINPNADYLQQLLGVAPSATYIKDDEGYQLIHYAAACQGPAPLNFLLSKGIDPDMGVTKNNITALMIAAKYGRDENVMALLGFDDDDQEEEEEAIYTDAETEKHGKPKANKNIKTKDGQTALHFAAENGHESTVRLLVRCGMNVDALTGTKFGNVSPIMLAAMKGHLGVVKALVELGASADKRGKWKKTALMYAVKNGHSPIAAFLLRIGVDANAADTSGNTPAHYAAAFGWLHCLQLLIQAKADPNAANTWKVTPLGIAMMKNNFPCAEFLLSLESVDVNYTDDLGRTLLAQTISNSALEGDIVEKIIFLVEKKGADVHRPDMKDWTPLHHLSSKSVYSRNQYFHEEFQCRSPPALEKEMSDASSKILNVLLRNGADPNAVDKDGITPIMMALLQNNFPLIKLLLENGARVSVGRDTQGKQILHYMAERGSLKLDLRVMYPEDCVPALEGGRYEREQKLNNFFEKQVKRANSETMELLVKGDGDINSQANNGLTPLMLALSECNLEQVSLLLTHGTDATIGVENTGRNVLHLLASKCLVVGTVDHLTSIAAKADGEKMRALVNAVDNNGFTSLLQACETYGSACNSLQVDKARNAKSFIKILIDQLGAGVSARVGKKNNSKEAVIRSVQTFGLSFTKNSSNTEKTKLKIVSMDTESDSDAEEDDEREESEEEEEMELDDDDDVDVDNDDDEDKDDELRTTAKEAAKSDEGQGEEPENEYGVTGRFSCLHFLCFEREKQDVEEGSESCLQILLTRVKDAKVINARDLHGRSPLHIAVKWNNQSAVKELISAGVDVNLLSDNESDALSPPVVLAAMKPCKPEILVELLNAGADPNIPNGKFSACALAYAVTNSPDSVSTPLEITNALLNAGANVNATDCNKRTALHYAVNTTTGGYEAMTEVEDLLIKHGADCAAVDIRGRIPLHYAFVKMESHSDTSLADPMSVVSLLCDAMVEQGLDSKKLINRQDKFGQTPFHRLALRGATICGLNLIQKGALFDIKDNDGNTPYGLAIREGHDGCAMMFSQMKAPPSTKIITPVTEEQKKQYESEKKASTWKYKGSVDLVEPKPVIKSAFRAVVENNWQGIAYLMLEVTGLDFVEAIQAALEAEKFELVWTLLRKQRHDSNLQGLDSLQHNLLHLLAIHAKDSYITNKIAMHLLQHGVSAVALDSQGAIPLHYAACNGNQELCELLLDNEPSTLDVPDKDNVTPLAAVFSGANGVMNRRFNLVKFFVEAGPKTLDVCYSIADWNETSTPLLEAILANDQKLVAYLIKNGASVNFARKDGKTPIMDAVLLGYEDMVKILLYGTDDTLKWKGPAKTDINLAAQDENGESVVHHCVQTREYGSSENVNMLQLLAKFNAPLNLKNKEGHTPLYIAKTQASGVMKNALLELLSEEQIAQDCEDPMETDAGFTFTTSLDKFFEGPPPDVGADAAAMMEQAALEEDQSVEEKSVPVDSSFGMQDIGEVYVDPDTKVPYDILMTKVDVKWGMWGLNNFYKMQVVYQKGKNLWILFNRWGRIGDSGQHQRTPFGDPKEATSEFRKIFKSKSGNEWENKDRFQKMPKKYQLVLPERNPERMRKPLKDVLKPFDLEKCKPSRLTEELQAFMKMLVDVSTMRNAVRNSGLNVDQSYMPFGCMGQETIDKARDVLCKIKNLLEGVDSRYIKETPDAEEKFSKIADLTNEFYMLIPVSNYRFERIRPLNEMHEIEHYLDALHKLSELAFVSKVLLGAQYRCKEVSPLDYCFRALGCKLELMDPASDECQLLLQYVQNSGDNRKISVKGIYRVTRPGEDERLAQSGVKTNHRLLWHGTRVSNMMGILNQGLRIAPPEAPTTGWSYGKGVYTSDSLDKSLNYCCLYDSGNEGFLLLCEVALGKMYECAGSEYLSGPPEGYNSTWAVTKMIPDPRDDVTTPYGVVVPCGPHVTNKAITEKYKDTYFSYYEKNEYIVYDERQVRLRYVVRFRQ